MIIKNNKIPVGSIVDCKTDFKSLMCLELFLPGDSAKDKMRGNVKMKEKINDKYIHLERFRSGTPPPNLYQVLTTTTTITNFKKYV